MAMAVVVAAVTGCGGDDDGGPSGSMSSGIEVVVSDDATPIAPLRDVTCRREGDTELVASGVVTSKGDDTHYVDIDVRFVDAEGVRVEIASDSVSDLLVGEAARWEASTYADGAADVHRCEVTATVG